MTLICVSKGLSLLSIFAGLFSALFWTRAATVSVRSSRPDNHYRDGQTVHGGTDFFQTATLQAKWNRWAAVAAAIAATAAAVAQAIGPHAN